MGTFPEDLSQAILVGIILVGRFGRRTAWWAICVTLCSSIDAMTWRGCAVMFLGVLSVIHLLLCDLCSRVCSLSMRAHVMSTLLMNVLIDSSVHPFMYWAMHTYTDTPHWWRHAILRVCQHVHTYVNVYSTYARARVGIYERQCNASETSQRTTSSRADTMYVSSSVTRIAGGGCRRWGSLVGLVLSCKFAMLHEVAIVGS